MLNGIAGTYVKGWRVTLKKGLSVSVMAGDDDGGKTCTLRRSGEVSRSNEKRARCFGMFQFIRPVCVTNKHKNRGMCRMKDSTDHYKLSSFDLRKSS